MFNRILDGFLEIVFGMLELLALIVPVVFTFALFSVLMISAWIPIALFQGYCLLLLWQWFILPLGVALPSLKTAIGVSLIINLLTAHLNQIESKKDLINHMIFWVVGQTLIVSAGYMVKTLFL